MARRNYTLIEFDPRGEVLVEHFRAPSDAVALDRAREVATPGRFQVWCDERIITDAAVRSERASLH